MLEFQPLQDDTLLVSYPRSGNHWMRFLIAHVKYPDHNWVNEDLNEAVPDIHRISKEFLSKCKSPRIIKSHTQYRKDYPKVIYLYRDGRDVAVSFYHRLKKLDKFKEDLNKFLFAFLVGNVPFGSWTEHVGSWLFREHKVPFMKVQYEELFQDTANVTKKVMEFLKIDASEEQIAEAVKKSAFKRLQGSRNFDVSGIGIDGKPGQWKTALSETQSKRFWESTNVTLKILGYKEE